MDLGIMTEGVLEMDPRTGRPVLRIQQEEGEVTLDVQEALFRYTGQEVRFICTPMKGIAELAKLVGE
jgi:hypothetical protein